MIGPARRAAFAAGEAGNPGSDGALIVELVQHAPALAERGAHRAARDDQQRHRIRIRLRDGGESVGHSGTGDHERRRRAAAHPRVAVGGKAGVLLVAYQHVAQAREFQAAVQLDVVHARNAEHGIDAVGRERLDNVASDSPGSGAHELEMLTPHTHSTNVKFSALVHRISGDGADAWLTHYQAVAARERGEDVILLSVGDPDLDTPAAVVERAVAQLRGGDTHYVPAAGRPALRQAIAGAHAARCGQAVGPDNVVYFAGAQNALFVASLCLAGPGDEVVTFEPLSPTYPATIGEAGARRLAGGAPGPGGARRTAGDVHAVRPAGFHPGGGAHRAHPRTRGRAAHPRVVRGAPGTLCGRNPRHPESAGDGARSGHVHADRCARPGALGRGIRARPVRRAARLGDGWRGVRALERALRARVLRHRRGAAGCRVLTGPALLRGAVG